MNVPRNARIWHILIGYLLWSVLFVALYALQALGCAAGWHRVPLGPLDLHRVVLIAVYAAGLLALVAVLRLQTAMPATEPPSAFLRRAGILATLAALGSSALIFAPVIAVTACH